MAIGIIAKHAIIPIAKLVGYRNRLTSEQPTVRGEGWGVRGGLTREHWNDNQLACRTDTVKWNAFKCIIFVSCPEFFGIFTVILQYHVVGIVDNFKHFILPSTFDVTDCND